MLFAMPDTPAMTISELTRQIKMTLEPHFVNLTVQGEISNFKKQSSGHLYFSLKDSKSQISAVMFQGNASKLPRLPKEGDQVQVVGDLSVYPPHGKYQLVVRQLEPLGAGELLLKLEQLKREIHSRGWFSKEHKKPLPHLPKRVGIVTSPTGAAVRDILNVLHRRFEGLHLLLNPVKVQGEGSAAEIAQAIEDFNRFELADVLIVGRGGGSIEDLWAFNEERVAKAIFESRIPIICAVGHETDHTIAEYVADLRAPTPSAAAEVVVQEREALMQTLLQLERGILHSVQQEIAKGKRALQGFTKVPHLSSPYPLLGFRMQRLDDLHLQLNHALRQRLTRKKEEIKARRAHLTALRPDIRVKQFIVKLLQLESQLQTRARNQLSRERERLRSLKAQVDQSMESQLTLAGSRFSATQFSKRLQNRVHQILEQKKERLTSLGELLQNVHPEALLSKGYAMLLDKASKKVVTSTHALKPTQEIELVLSDGSATATVEEVHHGKRKKL